MANKKTNGKTASGKPITHELVEELSKKAEAGYDVVEGSLPLLVTVTAGATEPRYPSLKGVMAAKQKPLERLSLADLGMSADQVAPTQSVVDVQDAPAKAAGEILEAGDDAVARIVGLLADAKVI